LLSYLQSGDDVEDAFEREIESEEEMFTPRAIKRQLAQFAAENQLQQTADPLKWWKENEARFRTISILARKYLSIPATSAPSERVFSLAGSICNRRRASLSPEHLNALVFLNANSDLL
jgi:hypothetical protein